MNSVVFNKMELVGAIKQFAPFPHQVLETIEIGVEIRKNQIHKILFAFQNTGLVPSNVGPVATKETINNVLESLGIITWVVFVVKLITSSTIGSIPGEANVNENPEKGFHVVNSLTSELSGPVVVLVMGQSVPDIHDLCTHKWDSTLHTDSQQETTNVNR